MRDGPEQIRRMLERAARPTDPILAKHQTEKRTDADIVGKIAYYTAMNGGQVSREVIIPEVSTTVALSDIKWKFGIENAKSMVEKMKSEIALIDPELDADDPIYQAAVLLKASTKFGQNEQALVLLTGFDAKLVKDVKRGARNCGIWTQGGRGRYASVDGGDWAATPKLLMLDAVAALGRIRRQPR